MRNGEKQIHSNVKLQKIYPEKVFYIFWEILFFFVFWMDADKALNKKSLIH